MAIGEISSANGEVRHDANKIVRPDRDSPYYSANVIVRCNINISAATLINEPYYRSVNYSPLYSVFNERINRLNAKIAIERQTRCLLRRK